PRAEPHPARPAAPLRGATPILTLPQAQPSGCAWGCPFPKREGFTGACELRRGTRHPKLLVGPAFTAPPETGQMSEVARSNGREARPIPLPSLFRGGWRAATGRGYGTSWIDALAR